MIKKRRNHLSNDEMDPQLINYLKEQKVSLEKIKSLIETEVDTELEKVEKIEKVEEVEKVTKEEPVDINLELKETKTPTFTIDDVKKLVSEEVKKSLKIKRKVPEKGKIVDKTEIQDEPHTETKRDVATKDWFERIV